MKPIGKSGMKQADDLCPLHFDFLKISLLGGSNQTKKRIEIHLDVSASDLCRL